MSKKLLVPFGLCFALGGQDFNDSTFPSSIVLQGGLREDTITPTKGNYQATTFGYGKNPFLGISGQAGSQYLLSINNPPNLTSGATTYYSGGFNIGSKIEFALSNVHTLAIQKGGINLQENSALTVLSSGTNIKPQGSEYGGASKIRFATGTKLILAQNTQARFHNASFFIHDGFTSLKQDAMLDIEAPTIRLQKNLDNDGGRLILQGNLYLIGNPLCHNTACSTSSNTIASLTSTQGEIIIKGDFYNGGIAEVDGANLIFNVFDPPFGGGGNLVLKGGIMEVKGEIFSQKGGTPTKDGDMLDPKDSSLGLYGGIIKTKKLNNKEGSTLSFGAYEGKMGQLQGELNNQQGKIVLDLSLAQEGDHQLVKGTTNVKATDITLKNFQTEFATARPTYTPTQEWDGWVRLKIDRNLVENFLNSLSPNESSILKGFGDLIYTAQGANKSTLKADAKALNQQLYLDFVATPFILLDTLKAQNTLLDYLPLSIDFGILAGGIAGGISGGFGGMKIGYHQRFESSFGSFFLTTQGIYNYGAIQGAKTDTQIIHSSTESFAHNLSLDLAVRFLSFVNPKIETDLKLGYFASFIHSKRHTALMSSQNEYFEAAYALHQIALDLQSGYRFALGNFFSLKPYLGLIQSFNRMPSFVENQLKGLRRDTYQAYQLNIALGLEGKYYFDSTKLLIAKMQFEQLAFNSQDFSLFLGDNPIKFHSPYSSKLNIDLQASFSLTQDINLNLNSYFESSFNHFRPLYSYGASGTLRYFF